MWLYFVIFFWLFCFYLLSWALTASEPDQSSSWPWKPPWLTPQTVGHSFEPSHTILLLCLLRIPKSVRCLGGPSGRQPTAGTSRIQEALRHSNHSGFPKAARIQLLLLQPEIINTFMRHWINPLGDTNVSLWSSSVSL